MDKRSKPLDTDRKYASAKERALDRPSVHAINRLLNLTGIMVPASTRSRRNIALGYTRACLLLLAAGLAVISVCMYMFEHRSQMGEYIIGIPYVSNTIILITTLLNSIAMRKQIGHLLRQIDRHIFTYADEERIHVEYPWLCREHNTKLVYFFIFAYQFSGFMTTFIPLYEHLVRKEKKSLMFPGWMPWNPEEYFLTTFVAQSVLAYSVFWIMFIISVFIAFSVIEFSRQNRRLCVALSSIEERSKEALVKAVNAGNIANWRHDHGNWKDHLANEVEINLKQCIKHHQKLMTLFRIFESWFSTLFLAELLADSLTFAVAFYNLFHTSSEVAYWALMASSYIFITSLFTRCLAGEFFSEMNEKIAEVIFYEVRWYEQSLHNKKLLSVFHSQVRRPMDLYAFSIFKASFFTFTSLMKTSYSYLNLLKASFSSKN